MNPKVVAIIILLSLCFFFGFNKISNYRNETRNSDIGELDILKYLPSSNKLLFISNFKSPNIINNIKKDLNKKNKEDLILIKNSILAYLGIDIGKNKLEDIYNNELTISTYGNNKNIKDDILIVFKIKTEKNLDDILNLSNKIDQSDQIISINRENKLNYLNYIYRTKDNYVLASSDKQLILDAIIDPNNNLKDIKTNYKNEILRNFKNQNNILFRKKFEKYLFFSDEISSNTNDDIIATTFALKDKDLVLKSYLINNKKNLDIFSYETLVNKNFINKDNFQISFYSDLRNSIKYLNPVLSNFEKSFLEEFNQKVQQNSLLLNSHKDWIIALENNDQNNLDINNMEKLKDFKKYSLEKNDNIYSIYSKNILGEEEDIIKKITFKDIYSFESKELFVISNQLISGGNIDLIAKKFSDLKNNNDTHDFLFKRIDMKNSYSNKNEHFSNLDDLNFLIKNTINLSYKEFIEVIKQSIPEKSPILYSEASIKMF